jgi:Asp-tRNA(Asn)/Glu-tRNA(Gln) amidotransferase A subunit family amidase
MALVGRRFAEATVLSLAHAYQGATDWHERRPQPAAAAS